jgi:hypothetical protein
VLPQGGLQDQQRSIVAILQRHIQNSADFGAHYRSAQSRGRICVCIFSLIRFHNQPSILFWALHLLFCSSSARVKIYISLGCNRRLIHVLSIHFDASVMKTKHSFSPSSASLSFTLVLACLLEFRSIDRFCTFLLYITFDCSCDQILYLAVSDWRNFRSNLHFIYDKFNCVERNNSKITIFSSSFYGKRVADYF